MTLMEEYNAAIARNDIKNDPEQRLLLVSLQRIADAIARQQSWYYWLPKKAIKGLYMVGPVGVGKTYMMDLFYQYLPGQQKVRMHYLHFMQQIDQQLRLLQGHKNPIRRIAIEFSRQYNVLCLDEFMVLDVAQAMILSELLPVLLAHRVVLVTTSNSVIDDLYRHGQNRERFLPTLALLHQHCDEAMLSSTLDYRVGRLGALESYMYPLTPEHMQVLVQQFEDMTVDARVGGDITIQHRSIAVVRVAKQVIWFDFSVICAMPRCQLDYIEIAERYHTLFISNIPILSHQPNNAGLVLFIQLIDVLYDRGVRLVALAASKAQDLYDSGPMIGPFARTLSRLEEMQSVDYIRGRCVIPSSQLIGH